MIFPKPKDQKKPPTPPVRIMKDGREICRINLKAGMDIYRDRVAQMLKRQGGRCCLEGHIPGCPGKLRLVEACFEHEAGRGFGGGHRDDRIERDGKPINGAAHFSCNSAKGSRRIDYSNVP